MFKKILVANRGEIAVRIIRSLREMNIQTLAVYSLEDKDGLWVQMADEAVCIGNANPEDSYLNIDRIISAALAYGCQAIHPGYGFLSEKIEMVRKCKENNLVWIGPGIESFELLEDKLVTKNLARQAGISVIEGSKEKIVSASQAREQAEKIGYPIFLKAANGGGGRGMRRVDSSEQISEQFELARQEAKLCFDDDTLYIEKLIEGPRHIEFQIIADQHGNICYCPERDCSIQRKNQKMLEESPSSSIDEKLRQEMGRAAIKIAKAFKYTNAGTVEFLLDKDKKFYFMEINSRIQVEHPLTEMIIGKDLIKEQVRIAAGARLSFKQEDLKISGHAMEIRVNAEDVIKNFTPSAGKIESLNIPGGFETRFDSYLYQGAKVSPFYDSMLAKIIVKADSRLACIRKMRRAIEESFIEGVKTNLAFQYAILFDKDFLKSSHDTLFFEKKKDILIEQVKEAIL